MTETDAETEVLTLEAQLIEAKKHLAAVRRESRLAELARVRANIDETEAKYRKLRSEAEVVATRENVVAQHLMTQYENLKQLQGQDDGLMGELAKRGDKEAKRWAKAVAETERRIAELRTDLAEIQSQRPDMQFLMECEGPVGLVARLRNRERQLVSLLNNAEQQPTHVRINGQLAPVIRY